MVGDGFLVLVSNLVSNLASLDEFLYQRFDGGCAFCYLLDELEVAGVQLVGLLRGEYARHALDVPQKLTAADGMMPWNGFESKRFWLRQNRCE